MRKIKTLHVNGHEVPVYQVKGILKDNGVEVMGLWCPTKKVIKIASDKRLKEFGLKRDHIVAHEVWHAVHYLCGFDGTFNIPAEYSSTINEWIAYHMGTIVEAIKGGIK